MSVGGLTTCGVTGDRDISCWGKGDLGARGDGDSTLKMGIPSSIVFGGHKWLNVSVGRRHACAITVDNDMYCWGGGDEGALGNGSTSNQSVPVAVSGNHKFRSVDAGYHATCGITTGNDLYCWGRNDSGELGDGNKGSGNDRSTPHLIASNVDQVDVGMHSTQALFLNGDMYSWGLNEQGGILGIGDSNTSSTYDTPQLISSGWNNKAVIADMSGEPEGSSNDTSLSIDVSGPSHITNYRYVIGNGSLNCDGASYSSEISIGTPITDNIETMKDGTIKVCVIVKTDTGTWLPESEAYEITWIKDTSPTEFQPSPGFARSGIPLTWTDGDSNGSNGFLVYRQEVGHGDISWTPADTAIYTVGTDIKSDANAYASSEIVYVGSLTSATDTLLLEDNKTYQYKVFAHNSEHEYTAGLQRLSKAYPYESISAANGSACATRFGRLRCWGKNTGHGSANTIGDNNSEFLLDLGDTKIGADDVDVLAVDIHWNHTN